MKKLLYILLISLLSFSCKKKGTLKVTITNVGTVKPMVNNSVYITELTNKVNGFGGNTVTHDFFSGTTNSDGELYINKKFDKRYTYEVFVDLPDNWAYVEDISHTMSVGDNYWKNGMDFKIANAAYLKLSIHNVNCQGAGDIINLDVKPAYDKNNGIVGKFTEQGCYSNDFLEGKVSAGPWEAVWQVTRNGVVTNHDTTFFIPENGHYHLTINY